MFRRYTILMLMVCCWAGLAAQHYQIGDVYTFPDSSQGVVFHVSPDGESGWAVALQDAEGLYTWGNNMDVPGIANQTQAHGVLNDTMGYAHTQALLNAHGTGNNYASGAVDFDNGWYLPTAMQLRLLHGQWPLIQSSLLAAGGVDMSNNLYWSSSEYNNKNAYQVSFYGGNTYIGASGYFTQESKSSMGKVRAVRNFTFPIYHWSTGASVSAITVNPTETTTYQVTVVNAQGCDTVVSHTIVVPVHDTAHFDITACDYYVWHGDTLTQSDVYVVTVSDAWGCDSVEVLNLEVNITPQVVVSVDTLIIDEGDTVTLHVSGAEHYQWHPENSLSDANSDSPLAFPTQSTYYHVRGYGPISEEDNLVVNGDFELGNTGFVTEYNYNPSPIYLLGYGNYTIQSDSYMWNSDSHHYGYGGSGWYMIVDGSPAPDVVLWSQTVEVQPNTLYEFSTWVVSLFHSFLSVAKLQFMVNGEQLGPIFNAPTVLYEWQRFHDYWNSGNDTVATITILNQNTDNQGNDFGIDHILFVPVDGCSQEDSVLVLVRHHVDSAVCENDLPIYWGGYELTGADTVEAVYTSEVTQLDSIVVLYLAENQITEDTIALSVLENDLPLILNDSAYYADSVYLQTLTNAAGCDSLLTIELEVIYNVTTYLDTTICADMLPFDWDSDHHFESADTLRDTLQTTRGADSVLVWALHVMPLPAPTHTPDTTKGSCLPVTLWAANAESFIWKNADGQQLSSGNTLTVNPETLTCYYLTATNLYVVGSASSIACRVTDTICVAVLPPDTTIVPTPACDYYVWFGDTLTVSGDYPHTLTDGQGCDSVVVLQLTVKTSSVGDTSAVVCGQFDWYEHTGITETGDYTHAFTNAVGCDSMVTLHLTIMNVTEGDTNAVACEQFDWYENIAITESGDYYHTFTDAMGCDSVVTLHLTILHPTAGDTTALVCGHFDWYEYTGITEEGDYVHTFTNETGCDSVVTLHLSIMDTVVQVVSLTEDFCTEMSAELSVITALPDYLWSTGETTPQITVNQPGTYSVTASEGDCRNSGYIVVEGCHPQLFLPNSITPSRSDGINDVFSIPELQRNYINDFEIRIFNRWGEQIFYSTDKNFQWNGESKGTITYNAVYAYTIHYTDAKGKTYVKRGSVTVL